MIHMFSVSKTYPSGITALWDLHLEVKAGEFVFVAGPSGSGKSTLLRILFGAEKPSSGEVIVNGIRLTRPNFKKIHRLRRAMGIISPDFKLLQNRNVTENVAFPLEVRGYSPKDIGERVSGALRQVGLQQREKDSILSLSTGEQQQVVIARALVDEPPLILADEPTGFLDKRMTEEIMAIFSELHQKGTTILFATQDTGLVQGCHQRVISLPACERGTVERSEGV